jgi:hypothetical protein
MTTVVFVHGTGIREVRFSRMFDTFQSNLRSRRPEVQVVPCGWGAFLGTSLAFGGASIPGYDQREPAKSVLDDDRDFPVLRWTVLEADPLHDLRFLAFTTASQRRLTAPLPGVRGFEETIHARMDELPGTGVLTTELARRNLGDCFAAAVRAVGSAVVTRQAIHQALDPAVQDRVCTALAEAVVAATCREVLEREGISPSLNARGRERLVDLVLDGLGGGQLGVGDDMKHLSALVAKRVGGWALERWRLPFTDGAQPAMGDIVRYLTRGDELRSAIAGVVRSVDDDVVLVGHSLGGVASLDLLLLTSLPAVRTLVTVGAQGPLLFELDALPGLAVGATVPDTLPTWTNYYDCRDVLSYLAEPIFPEHAKDVKVDNGLGMPLAHSAYFDNGGFYDSLVEVINTGTRS